MLLERALRGRAAQQQQTASGSHAQSAASTGSASASPSANELPRSPGPSKSAAGASDSTFAARFFSRFAALRLRFSSCRRGQAKGMRGGE
jgi:hypothetical protein